MTRLLDVLSTQRLGCRCVSCKGLCGGTECNIQTRLFAHYSCSIMYYTRPRYFTLGTSWIYKPRSSSPIFGVALRIILAHTDTFILKIVIAQLFSACSYVQLDEFLADACAYPAWCLQ